MRSNVFIGSASETLSIAKSIRDDLEADADVELWSEDTFESGDYTLEALIDQANRSDFGIFIVGRSDKTDSRGEENLSPRDNVVYEAGLFHGVIGRKRTVLAVHSDTKIPSDWNGLERIGTDWNGLTIVPYRNSKRGQNEIINVARKKIAKLGPKKLESLESKIIGNWWQFVTNQDEESAVSLFELRPSKSKRGVELCNGKAWSKEGNHVANFDSQAVSVDQVNLKLFYSWVGCLPNKIDRPEYFGIGEITFDDSEELIHSARKGIFTSTSKSNPADTFKKSCEYRRVSEKEFVIMKNGSFEERKDLVNKLLEERRNRIDF